MNKKYYAASRNIYVIPLKMPDNPESEWKENDITDVARDAALQIKELFDELAEQSRYKDVEEEE